MPISGLNVPEGNHGFLRIFHLLLAMSIQVILLDVDPGALGFFSAAGYRDILYQVNLCLGNRLLAAVSCNLALDRYHIA